MAILFFIGLIVLFSFGPIDFANAAWRSNNRKVKNGKVLHKKKPQNIKILGALPGGCVCVTRYAFYKKYGWTAPVAIICIPLILLRLVLAGVPAIANLAATNTALGILQIYSLPIMYFGLVLFHLLHVITYIDIMRLFRFGWVSYLFAVLFPYGIAFYLASQIPAQLNAQNEKQQNRFNENYKAPTKKKRRSTT